MVNSEDRTDCVCARGTKPPHGDDHAITRCAADRVGLFVNLGPDAVPTRDARVVVGLPISSGDVIGDDEKDGNVAGVGESVGGERDLKRSPCAGSASSAASTDGGDCQLSHASGQGDNGSGSM